MNVKRCICDIFLLCWLLCIGHQPVYSQIWVQKSAITHYLSNDGTRIAVPPEIDVFVEDSLTSAPLPDVIIAIAREKDTARFVTNSIGLVSFGNKYIKDTVLVTASLLGYKTQSLRTAFNEPSMTVSIRMAEDIKELNAIIVKDNAVLMVEKGDTTVYNVESLKTMEGDDLARLLKRLPGIRLEDNGVYAGGRRVNKILINGTTLFGSSISSALSLVGSDMVKKIRVYDEHPQDRLVESDTLGVKDHVIDVVTKKPLTRVQRTRLDAVLGLFTDKGSSGRNDFIAGTSADYQRFKNESPNITARAGVGKNDNSMMSEPLDKIFADVSLKHSRKFRDRYGHNLSFSLDRSGANTIVKEDYLNMDRSDERLSKKTSTDMSIRYSGNYYFKSDDRNLFNLSGSADFETDRDIAEASEEMRANGNIYVSGMSDDNRVKTLSADVSLHYRHLFENERRELSVSVAIPFAYSWGGRHLVDTLQSSSYPQWLTDDSGISKFSPSFNVSFREPIVSGLSLTMSADMIGQMSRDHRSSFDRILQSENTVRTYDYLQNSLSGNVKASFSYYRNEFSVHAGVEAKITDQVLLTKSGNAGNLDKVYFHVSPLFRMKWEKSKFTAELSYKEDGRCPAVYMLRNLLDYTNPLTLTAGNPNLRLPVERNAAASFSTTSFSTGTSWEFSASYTHHSNIVGSNTEYFDSNVYLDDYGYEAVAGSRLLKAANIGDGWEFNTAASAGFFVNPIKSNFMLKLGTMIARTPFMTAGNVNMSGTDELNAIIMYTSSFSSIFTLSANLDYGLGLHTLNSDKVYAYSNIYLGVQPGFMLFKHWHTSVDYKLNAMLTDREGAGYMLNRLDISSGYTFGKSTKYEVGLNFLDVLNSRSSRSVSVNELYIRNTMRTLLGRGVCVRFSVIFK